MTLDELKQSLQQQIEAATADVEHHTAELRKAEIKLAFLQGQLHGLNQIRIERPIYSSSDNSRDLGPFLNTPGEEQSDA